MFIDGGLAMRNLVIVCVLTALASCCFATIVLDPVPAIPKGVDGLKTEHAYVDIFTKEEIGPMPRPHTDISQGAETGDPNFYIEMSEMLGKIGARLVRCDPFADTSKIVVTPDGKVKIDFSAADAICDALARAGAKPCWNIASFPKEMMEGNRPKADLLDQFVYQVTYHWNVEQKRGIQYYEYLNEPGGFDGERFEVVVKAAHRADPSVKVGGPAVMGCPLEILEETVKYCKERNIPLGFLSFHLYYEMPEGFLDYVEKVEQILAKYPGTEDVEILLTEWGVDAGISGSCDTLYNAAYYCSILKSVMHKWPRVHPMHFEFRDGWDAIGPSRDLWGRWGMVTYPNLLPKPVYNAGLMWNMMADTEIKAVSTNPDVQVIAAKNDHKVSILIWSWPKEYQKLLANSIRMSTSPLDIPVKIRVHGLPFKSPGVRYRRYVVDQTHSNLSFDIYTSDLQKVHDVILAHSGPGKEKNLTDDFETEIILPLHAVTLIELLPEDRPPVNVEAVSDKFRIWTGEKARVTIIPRFNEDLDLELVTDPANRSPWKITPISSKPLSFYLEPPISNVKSMHYFTAWVRNKKSRALGRVILELQSDSPVVLSVPAQHVDIPADTRIGQVPIKIINKTPEKRVVELIWEAPKGITVKTNSCKLTLHPSTTTEVKVNVIFDKTMRPDRYNLVAKLKSGCILDSATVPVHLPLQCPRRKNKIKLDGDLSEWQNVPSVKVASSGDYDGHSYREWGGENDLCGRIWTQWDEENLYFAFRVMDNEHVQKVNTWQMKDYDSVHVGFDLRRDSIDPNEFFDESDCDYVFGYFDNKGWAYRHWGAKRPMDFADGVQIAAKKVGNIITYEIAMNWKREFLPYAKPTAGETIGCSIYFRDVDEGKHEAEMRWGRGLAWDEKRPALFNSIYLTE
jgi:hypothetical protein